jgi:hypothetical protein
MREEYDKRDLPSVAGMARPLETRESSEQLARINQLISSITDKLDPVLVFRNADGLAQEKSAKSYLLHELENIVDRLQNLSEAINL